VADAFNVYTPKQLAFLGAPNLHPKKPHDFSGTPYKKTSGEDRLLFIIKYQNFYQKLFLSLKPPLPFVGLALLL
jgi:hypothetical protein